MRIRRSAPAKTPRVIVREKRTVAAMIRIYCADHHRLPAGALCDTCQALLEYADGRLDRCPYGGDKPSCKVCPIHCYRPESREAMRAVMRYAGPRMFWRHPWLAVAHLWQERTRSKPRRPPRWG